MDMAGLVPSYVESSNLFRESTGADLRLVTSYINIRRGAYIGLILSIAMCPWQLLSSAATFISVLSAYSVFLGPMVGIMVCDCEYPGIRDSPRFILMCDHSIDWILRNRRVKLSDLYHPRKEGLYHYWHGVNWRAFISWTVGWAYLIPGFAHAVTPSVVVPQACTDLYRLAFPLGFVVSFLAHWGINLLSPPPGLGVSDDVDYYGTFTTDEAEKLGVAPGHTIDGEDIRVDDHHEKATGEPIVAKV